jgi:hypothetical protein
MFVNDNRFDKNEEGLYYFGVFGEFMNGGKYFDEFVKGAKPYRKGLTREAKIDEASGLIRNDFNSDNMVNFEIYLMTEEQIEKIYDYFEGNDLGKMYCEQTEFADELGRCVNCYLIFAPGEISADDRPDLPNS